MISDGACKGLKVLAVTRVLGSPFCAYQLALHGADVINIEDPDAGDVTRSVGGDHTRHLTEHGLGVGFLPHAANKRSLTLNLTDPRGQAVFRRLAEDADVIIENLRVGAMERYGLGYEAIREINPRIVYASFTGYGQHGARRHAPAFDNAIQAGSGMMSVNGTPETGPTRVTGSVVDYTAGFAMTVGIMMALYGREKTGRGQFLDVALFDTALVMMGRMVSDVMNGGLEPRLLGNWGENEAHILQRFRCSDAYIMLSTIQDNHRTRLWDALGRPDLHENPKFKTIQAIRQNVAEVYAEIGECLKARTAAEWERIFQAAGVPAMRVNTVKEAVEDPDVKARLFHEFKDLAGVPGLNATVPLASYRLSEGGARITAPPPLLGQHSDEILAQHGYTAESIEALRTEGII